MSNVGGYYNWRVLKISQFGEDLIWRYYCKKVGGLDIFYLATTNFFNSPNKSSPIINRLYSIA